MASSHWQCLDKANSRLAAHVVVWLSVCVSALVCAIAAARTILSFEVQLESGRERRMESRLHLSLG